MMNNDNGGVAIQQLDEVRFAVTVNGLVRYVGRQAECEIRATILLRKNDRATQDQALLRWVSLSS
jgi:hypothetical protein